MFKKSILLIAILSVFIGCKSSEEVEKSTIKSAAKSQQKSDNSSAY